MGNDKRPDEAVGVDVEDSAHIPLNLFELVEACLEEVSFAGPCVGDQGPSAVNMPSLKG